jgi:hypothetical protein
MFVQTGDDLVDRLRVPDHRDNRHSPAAARTAKDIDALLPVAAQTKRLRRPLIQLQAKIAVLARVFFVIQTRKSGKPFPEQALQDIRLTRAVLAPGSCFRPRSENRRHIHNNAESDVMLAGLYSSGRISWNKDISQIVEPFSEADLLHQVVARGYAIFLIGDDSLEERVKILTLFCGRSALKLTAPAEKKPPALFRKAYAERDWSFGNGRPARNLFEKVAERQANRLVEIAPLTREILSTLTPEDIP